MQSTFPQRRRKPPTGAKQRKLFRTAPRRQARASSRGASQKRRAEGASACHAPPQKCTLPQQLSPLTPSARLLREPRRRFAQQSGLSRPRRRPRRLSRSPQYPPTPINAATRTPARRSALGLAERGRRRLSPPPPNAVLPFWQNRAPRPLPTKNAAHE